MKDKIILLFLFLFAIFFFSKKIEKPQAIDAKYYYEMARKIPQLDSIPLPFKQRILAPFLAKLLSSNLSLNFFILSLITILIFIFLFYHYLLKKEIRKETALLIIFFLLFNKYHFGCFIFDFYRLNEILALLLILLFFYGLEIKNFLLLLFAFFLGVLAREIVVLLCLVALFYTFKEKKNDYFLACLPGLGIFIFVRLLFKDNDFSYLVSALFDYGKKIYSLSALSRLFINAFAPLTLIPIIEYQLTFSYIKRNFDKFLFFILIFLSTLLGKDNERLMAPVFIFFYPLIGEIFERKMKDKKFLILLAILGFPSAFHHYWNRFPIKRDLTMILSFFSLFSITLTYYFIGIRNKERY